MIAVSGDVPIAVEVERNESRRLWPRHRLYWPASQSCGSGTDDSVGSPVFCA